jgi:tetratricopeptide (TPR) repeat protein
MEMCWQYRCAVGVVSFSLVFSSFTPRFAEAGTPRNLPSATDHLHAGLKFEREKKWAEAEREFRIARQEDPNSAAAAIGHAESLVQLGQPFDAELELQSFVQEHPRSERAHEFYAVVALGASDDFLVAKNELQTCVTLEPNNALAWKSLGDVYLGTAQSSEAVKAYSKSSRLLPNNPMIVAALGDAYSENGEKEKADEAFRRAIKMTAVSSQSPQDRKSQAAVQYLYGKYLLGENRAKESVAATTLALSFNPRSAAALLNRARAYQAIQDYKHAEADALSAFQFDPHDKEGPLLLVGIYRKANEPEKAQKYADIAQKLVDQEQEHSVFVRDLLGLLGTAERELKKGQFEDAIPPYEELLKKLPTFYEAYFGLGMCYSQTGRLEDAEAAFRKYLSFEQISADGHASLGILLLQEKRAQDAVPELEKALQIDPTMDETRKVLAQEYARERKPNEAIRTLRAAVSSRDVQIKIMLANLLLENGDVAAATREVRLALALQPNDAAALQLQQDILSRGSMPK